MQVTQEISIYEELGEHMSSMEERLFRMMEDFTSRQVEINNRSEERTASLASGLEVLQRSSLGTPPVQPVAQPPLSAQQQPPLSAQ